MLLFSLLACETPSIDSGDSGGDSALETGDTGGETGETGDSGAAPVAQNYVLIQFTVADRNIGFDLNNDGEVDNAIWPIGSVLDPLISTALSTAQHVSIVQASDIDSFTDDNSIRVGVFTAEDADGDGTDNASGTESFAGGAQVDEAGLVVVGTETPLAAGAYTVQLATGTLPVGSYDLELATGLFVSSQIDPHSQTGLLGFGISIEALDVALTAEGVAPEMIAAIEALADLDLDGDTVPDAVSMAFTFDAAACLVE